MAKINGRSPATRLELGAAVLAAAHALDTRPIKDRLARFERAHHTYATAYAKVETAEEQLRAAQVRVAERDVDQDKAVEAVTRALVADGRDRFNPFAVFGLPSPGAIVRLPIADEMATIGRLVSAIQQDKMASKATLQAAQAVDKAARAVEQALAPIDKPTAAVREARQMRDATTQGWEIAYAALRRDAQAATAEGAAGLYPALFGATARPAAKASKPAPVPAPVAS